MNLGQAYQGWQQQSASMREKNTKKLPNFTHILKPKEEIERLSRKLDDSPAKLVESAAVEKATGRRDTSLGNQQPLPSAIPADHQHAASDALKVFTDDELIAALTERGRQGELTRVQRITIGKKED